MLSRTHPSARGGDPVVRPAPEISALDAELHYNSDAEPGLSRRRAGKGFRYVDARGKRVTDERTLARIRSIVIPPAWTDVWISPDAKGHIQATGRDQRGRKQYRYHERWSASRDQVKYSSLASFAQALPKLRERLDADLRKRGLSRERVLASVVWLLDNTMIRIGNAAYARDNKSFGLTTLRSRHVEVEGAKLRFAFRGKSGQEWKIKLVDRRMAKVLRSIQELPGQHLFQYLDEEGKRRPVHSQDVNDYIREASGSEFSSKHFRTWGGTVHALARFAEMPLPDTKRDQARQLNAIVDEVASRLGNTRAVCRRCYIHPEVIDQWLQGTLQENVAAARRTRRKPIVGLDDEENLLLRWLGQERPTLLAQLKASAEA